MTILLGRSIVQSMNTERKRETDMNDFYLRFFSCVLLLLLKKGERERMINSRARDLNFNNSL